MNNRCLYCYLALADGEIDFHPSCSKKIFGTAVPPLMPYSEENLNELAEQIIKSQTTITKRIDKWKGGKLHMEDMCQLTERLTEDKYQGSYEQIAKAILKYSVNPNDDEDLALTLSGKKKKINRDDFNKAFNTMGLCKAVGERFERLGC